MRRLFFLPIRTPVRLVKNIKMAEKREKNTASAVPLHTLPERCTMTMHHEISARGSLMPAGDGSAMLSDTLSLTRQ